MARDYSREAAHRRYEEAYRLAQAAGADTQAAVNAAYSELNENAGWNPKADWGESFQEGEPATPPSWLDEDLEFPRAHINVLGPEPPKNDVSQFSPIPIREDEGPEKFLEAAGIDINGLTPGFSASPDISGMRPSDAFPGLRQYGLTKSLSGYAPTRSITPNGGDESEQSNDVVVTEGNPYSYAKPGTGGAAGRDGNPQPGGTAGRAGNPQPEELYGMYWGDGSDLQPEDLSFENLVLGENSPLNLNNIPFIGGSPREKAETKKKKAYREANPMPEGAFDEHGRTSQTYLDKYNEMFANEGGIDDSSTSGLSDVRSWLSSAYDPEASVEQLPEGGLIGAFDKLAKETVDDGTLRRGNLESNHMTGEQYKKYVAAGFGGRPIEDIDDNETYNKLEEMRDYNFIPYIASDDQLGTWNFASVPNEVTKFFNLFGDTRNRSWEPTMNYNGTDINIKDMREAKERFLRQQDAYDKGYAVEPPTWRFRMVDESSGEYQDVAATMDSMRYGYVGDLKEANPSLAEEFANEPDDSVVVWFDGQPGAWTYSSREAAIAGTQSSPLVEFDQLDGTHVGPIALDDFSESYNAGQVSENWGPANIGKGPGDRKSFVEMFGSIPTEGISGFAEDLVPNMVDLFLQSAPIMIPQTGWPMSIANAMTALQGLDPRTYDSDRNAYYALAPMQDMNAQRYLLNTGLSGTVPATENIAGGIGGSGGVVGRPIKKALMKMGAPGAALVLLDALGEGLEEVVASSWEDAQTYGLPIPGIGGSFANPVYETNQDGSIKLDSNGNPVTKIDESGHVERDFDTPVPDRVKNFVDQALENFLAGFSLGLPFSAMNGGKIDEKYANPVGYVPRGSDELYETDNEGRLKSKITADDFGTYDSRR